ncbi:MAG TPA: deoxyribonuclease IV [Candidatus Nitrosopolaris sp.]|nr:deoxyribonuclease IV [Candidatus Nitrosopolaris sp.]
MGIRLIFISKKMKVRVGFHVSIAGGIANSVDNALKIGCSAFQIFTRNPRGWTAKPLVNEDVMKFRAKLAKSPISSEAVIVHMPYLPNLAAPEGTLYQKSVHTLAEEVQRCITLGIPSLVIHLGSHLGKGTEQGISQLVKACTYAFDNCRKNASSHANQSKQKTTSKNAPVRILLENMAGQKNSVGGKFEEIRLLLDRLKPIGRFGVCLDTCHVFASGIDLRKEVDVERMLNQFDSTVGLKELKALHLNDSKGDLDSRIDRHEHIGLGKIGKAGFAALLRHKSLRNRPMIMETPVDDQRNDVDNLKVVLDLASNPQKT